MRSMILIWETSFGGLKYEAISNETHAITN